MTITEFLGARIAEDEALARTALVGRHGAHKDDWDWAGYVLAADRDSTTKQDEFITAWWPQRVLDECAAKRAIMKLHEDWPVLVEGPPVFSQEGRADLQSVTFGLSREIMWLTEREYCTRFGTEPPAAPMVRALAAVYANHPDYQREWAK